MIDLGQTLFRKHYFFQKIELHQILINPRIKGYPPIFLLCREKRGSKHYEFIVGMNFERLNELLMKIPESQKRLDLSAEIAKYLIPKECTAEISVPQVVGKAIVLTDLDLFTRVRRFNLDPDDVKNALYYFQVLEG